MTMLPVPASPFETPDWRAIHATPPDVRLEDGAWCPLDDTVLDLELRGYLCPKCLGWWDQHGRNGMWVDAGLPIEGHLVGARVIDLAERRPVPASSLRRLDRVTAAVVAGCGVLILGAYCARLLLDAGMLAGPNVGLGAAVMAGGLVLIAAGLILLRWVGWLGGRGGAR